jgi:hypothetical protein
MRRLAAVVGSTLAMAACGGDRVAAPNTPNLTTAQLALALDSIAGVLSPSDPRIHWLQQIDNGLALGAGRTLIEIDIDGQARLLWAVATATIRSLDTTGRAGAVDSTYVLIGWEGGLMPISFLELDINYLRRTGGQADTAESGVTFFADSDASGLVADTTVAAVQNTVIRGDCTPVTLMHLVLPTGHCTLISTQVGYQSSINGMPFRALLGSRLTPTS